jgi:hypothetical protein
MAKTKKKVPKGYHRMPDGSMMSDKLMDQMMKKPKRKKPKTKGGVKGGYR